MDINLFLQETRYYIDKKLYEHIIIHDPKLSTLYSSIHYTLHAGGKRIRPIFCFAVGEMFDLSREKLTNLACALEMIHTASLIMDDLPYMDDGTMRRGKLANHLMYGQDVAVLASLSLLCRAYEVVVNDRTLPDDTKTKVVAKLLQTVGLTGMVGGQFVDRTVLDTQMSLPILAYIQAHKTASLFVASGEGPAIIGGASAHEIDSIKTFSSNVGYAFQISDDLLDVTGVIQETGKSLQKDRTNSVTFFGIEGAKKRVEKHIAQAFEALKAFEGKNTKLLALSNLLLQRRT
jgi:geranylgeranyl diphosphate synthase, type II